MDSRRYWDWAEGNVSRVYWAKSVAKVYQSVKEISESKQMYTSSLWEQYNSF